MATPITPSADEFTVLVDPYRRELLAHCYRMLGSLHDAEDLVQETYLKAWRAYDKFEGRSSLRTWLHKIATTTCLTALDARRRRPLPSGLGGSSDEMPQAKVLELAEVPWREQIPDAMRAEGDPAAVVGQRESIRLAFIAVLRFLPSRQRAVLILRDVLQWRAAEVAESLGISTAAVNSALQRARAQLADTAPSENERPEPLTVEQERLLERYIAAFESKDIPAIVRLFTTEATRHMAPYQPWVVGEGRIAEVPERRRPAEDDGTLLLPTGVDRAQRLGAYPRGDDVARLGPLTALDLDETPGREVVAFVDSNFTQTSRSETCSA